MTAVSRTTERARRRARGTALGSTPRPRADGAGRAGFTLLELMATVAVMALIVAMVVPGLGAARSAALRQQSRDLAALLELARRRAVTSGAPHRVWFDLESAAYRLEWQVGDEEAFGVGAAGGPEPELDLRGQTPIPMSPKRDETIDFRPVPITLGRWSEFSDGLFVEGIETSEGWIDRGSIGVFFDRDGSADHAEILLTDGEERRIWLSVRPLLDVVRIHYDDS